MGERRGFILGAGPFFNIYGNVPGPGAGSEIIRFVASVAKFTPGEFAIRANLAISGFEEIALLALALDVTYRSGSCVVLLIFGTIFCLLKN